MSKQLKDIKEGEIVMRMVLGAVPMQLRVRVVTPEHIIAQAIERNEKYDNQYGPDAGLPFWAFETNTGAETDIPRGVFDSYIIPI